MWLGSTQLPKLFHRPGEVSGACDIPRTKAPIPARKGYAGVDGRAQSRHHLLSASRWKVSTSPSSPETAEPASPQARLFAAERPAVRPENRQPPRKVPSREL
jgi:hypothetical protein